MNRSFSLKIIAAAALALAGACATPPKPPELTAFEHLRSSPQAKQAEAVAPAVMKRADKLMSDATEEWKENELDESRHSALYGQAKVKHAVAVLQQADAKERIKKAKRARVKADDDAGRLETQLKALNEQVALLEQLHKQKQEREQLSAELQKQRDSATAEKQTLSQKLQQEKDRAEAVDKVKAAELAIKEADTVDAKRLASGPYQAALDMLARAQQELQNNQYDAARISADMSRQRSAAALEAARPEFTKEMEANGRRNQAEALAGDAAQIQSVEVRREARGQLQRLVLHVPAAILFKGTGTTIVPGSEAVLDRLAQLIGKYPTFPVQLVGHTDSRGKNDALLARAHARAQAVFNALVTRGVAPNRLVVSGQGGAEPVSDNRGATGRARNNRVEVVFLYQ